MSLLRPYLLSSPLSCVVLRGRQVLEEARGRVEGCVCAASQRAVPRAIHQTHRQGNETWRTSQRPIAQRFTSHVPLVQFFFLCVDL